jgi:hypothetical protein
VGVWQPQTVGVWQPTPNGETVGVWQPTPNGETVGVWQPTVKRWVSGNPNGGCLATLATQTVGVWQPNGGCLATPNGETVGVWQPTPQTVKRWVSGNPRLTVGVWQPEFPLAKRWVSGNLGVGTDHRNGVSFDHQHGSASAGSKGYDVIGAYTDVARHATKARSPIDAGSMAWLSSVRTGRPGIRAC